MADPATDSHSSGTPVTGRLERPTRKPLRAAGCAKRKLPYLVLLRLGFTLPLPLPAARCALTAPFHPCHPETGFGGLFSVALSVGSRLPGVTWQSALWSPDFPPSLARQRLSDRLPPANIVPMGRVCKSTSTTCIWCFTQSPPRTQRI